MALAELWEALGELWKGLYIEKLPTNRTSGRYVLFCGGNQSLGEEYILFSGNNLILGEEYSLSGG